MKNGYDQFFQSKRQSAVAPQAKIKQPVKQAAQTQTQNKSNRDLAGELRLQMKNKKAEKKPKSIPWKIASISFLGILLAAYGLMNFEELEKTISKIEIQMFGEAFAEGTTTTTVKAGNGQEAAAAEKKPVSLANLSAEETDYYKKLNERKSELDKREEELNRMESELQAQKEALEKRLSELENTRREISSVLEEKVQTDDKKVDSLVQMYSNMKPSQAAKVFESMDESLAVEILGRMKKKNAAEIMNLIKAEKAQVFSEKYAGYRK